MYWNLPIDAPAAPAVVLARFYGYLRLSGAVNMAQNTALYLSGVEYHYLDTFIACLSSDD